MFGLYFIGVLPFIQICSRVFRLFQVSQKSIEKSDFSRIEVVKEAKNREDLKCDFFLSYLFQVE